MACGLQGCESANKKNERQQAKIEKLKEDIFKTYEGKYGVVPEDLNGLRVSASPSYPDIRYYSNGFIEEKYKRHLSQVSERWIILNAETLEEITAEPSLIQKKDNGFRINTRHEKLKAVKSLLICFKGIDKTEWEAKETVPLFFAMVNDDSVSSGAIWIGKPFLAEELFKEANIPLEKTPLPVIYKTVISQYIYEKELDSGETLSATITLYTEGEKKSVGLNINFKTISGNRTSEQSFSTVTPIQVEADGSFSIMEENNIKGIVKDDKITITISRGSSSYQFTANPKN